MKIFVKTLKGSSFEIQVEPQHKIVDVKRNIESSQGKSVYPAEQQMLIHSGKVLNDETTLEENGVKESSFLVIMLSKTKTSSSGASSTPKPPLMPVPCAVTSLPAAVPSQTPAATVISAPPSVPTTTVTAIPSSANEDAGAYGQAASSLVSDNNLEQTVQQLLDMGGGTWDRDTVSRALHAAFNNPERAVEYLYSGIPENVEAPPVAEAPVVGANSPVQVPQPVQPLVPSSGPNANPLDLFPQGLPNVGSNASTGSLDLLRNNPQFRALQNLVQANPQVLQPMLQELARQNPQVMRLIQEHQGEFLSLLNEPDEGAEGNLLGEDFAAEMPPAIELTPDEHEAIERLEAMGFDRALVLEVFVACNRNEQLAANYLLDHMHEFEE